MRMQNDFGAVKAFFFKSKEEEILHRFTVRIFQNEIFLVYLVAILYEYFFFQFSQKIVKNHEKSSKIMKKRIMKNHRKSLKNGR